jgi:Lrp/AsnC family transcriptional regulator for asnA, asnC and gidA
MNNHSAVAQLQKINEVLECHYTTGDWSILVKILCKDNEHLMNLLNNQIQKIAGISRTETFISLDQQIARQIKV